VEKAENDYAIAGVLVRSRKRGRNDGICFHSQQCAEKYLKARLIESGLAFPRTHELSVLLTLALAIEPLWAVFAPELRVLATWAVLPRYPGVNPDTASARSAIHICRRFRDVARPALGLKP
jgi:HEPN domain-containing protein